MSVTIKSHERRGRKKTEWNYGGAGKMRSVSVPKPLGELALSATKIIDKFASGKLTTEEASLHFNALLIDIKD